MNDKGQSQLSNAEYEHMEWLETKEDRGVMTLSEKEELTALQLRWTSNIGQPSDGA